MELTKLTKLERLYLHKNKLTGEPMWGGPSGNAPPLIDRFNV